MPFNKIWMFDHENTHTEVIITDFINYKTDNLAKFLKEVNELR